MSRVRQNSNLAAWMGRWRAAHWKTATFGTAPEAKPVPAPHSPGVECLAPSSRGRGCPAKW